MSIHGFSKTYCLLLIGCLKSVYQTRNRSKSLLKFCGRNNFLK